MGSTSGEGFLDSNVLVYTFEKTDAALGLVRNGAADDSAVISFQVVQETLHALTRKSNNGT